MMLRNYRYEVFMKKSNKIAKKSLECADRL